MLNSVGLQNPGIDHFIKEELPYLMQKDVTIIANVAGSTVEDCIEIAHKLEGTAVDMIELNISCPNVKQGGAAFGTSPEMAASVTRAVRNATTKPLMVKLSPNVTSIVDIAKAVEAEGADAISLINTLLGLLLGIAGLVLAGKAKRLGFMGGMRTAGFVMSLISVILGAVLFVLALAAMAAAIGIAGMGTFF